MALTEREKAILRLKAEGVSDYKIARKLRMETPNVTRSRKNALKKLERAKADLDFVARLKSPRPAFLTSNA
ncbi:MAG: LuxR C-terminal-related transcriptional regulator [Candidatus Bathyarchaeota archaeon]|nr:LuxR C-terminal-related transcriptional regulator [Candidatus Bathyarchaeota archaeon]